MNQNCIESFDLVKIQLSLNYKYSQDTLDKYLNPEKYMFKQTENNESPLMDLLLGDGFNTNPEDEFNSEDDSVCMMAIDENDVTSKTSQEENHDEAVVKEEVVCQNIPTRISKHKMKPKSFIGTSTKSFIGTSTRRSASKRNPKRNLRNKTII